MKNIDVAEAYLGILAINGFFFLVVIIPLIIAGLTVSLLLSLNV